MIKKIEFALDIGLVIIMTIATLYCLIKGFSNHDAFFLLVGLLDYIIVQFSIKNMEIDVDRLNKQ